MALQTLSSCWSLLYELCFHFSEAGTVVTRTTRRQFTAEYKLAILLEAQLLKKKGQVRALLEREGLRASHLANWRRTAKLGQIAALSPKRRGRKAKRLENQELQIRKLKQQNAALQQRCERAEELVKAQKKVLMYAAVRMSGL
jgi:hypothetical protein